MSDVEKLSPRSPEHAELQCHRVLDAAERCFIEHGFHAASMANISQHADMSPGLIYRYFENKDAIILAIIERHIRKRRCEVERLQEDFDFVGRIIDLFASWQKEDPEVMNPALFLEMSAEATRNPRIAKAINDADQETRRNLANWLQSADANNITPEDAAERAFALQAFIEGLAVRAVREPDIDLQKVAACARRFLPELMKIS